MEGGSVAPGADGRAFASPPARAPSFDGGASVRIGAADPAPSAETPAPPATAKDASSRMGMRRRMIPIRQSALALGPFGSFGPAPGRGHVRCVAASSKAWHNSSWVSAACDGPARDVRRGRRERTGTRAMRSASGRQAPRDSRPRGAPWPRLASPSPHPPCAAADLPAAPPPLPMRPARSVRAVRRGIRQPGPLRDDSRAPTTAGSQPTRPCPRRG